MSGFNEKVSALAKKGATVAILVGTTWIQGTLVEENWDYLIMDDGILVTLVRQDRISAVRVIEAKGGER